MKIFLKSNNISNTFYINIICINGIKYIFIMIFWIIIIMLNNKKYFNKIGREIIIS